MYCFVFKAFMVKRTDLADILRNLQLPDAFLFKHRSFPLCPTMGRVCLSLSLSLSHTFSLKPPASYQLSSFVTDLYPDLMFVEHLLLPTNIMSK